MSLTELTAGENKFFESGGQEAPPETTEVAAPEPVTNPAPTAPTAPVQQDDKQVPLAALHEARKIQKELRDELSRAREEAKAAAERADKYSSTFEKFLAERTKEAAPKYEEDPLGALKYENDQLKKQVEEVNTGVKKTQDEWQRTQQYQSFAQHVQSQEASYKQQAQDYDQAIAYLKDVRLQDYADLGYTQEDATAALQSEILGLAQAAVQKGKNAADVAYKMAQRYGYKSGKARFDAEVSKLERLAKGQEASKSLAGGKADVDVSLDALSQLDDEQLNALIKDDAAWKKLGR
jgi:hypothetical protein